MSVMLKDIRVEAGKYYLKFESFIKKNRLANLEPVTIGWKVQDIDEYNETISKFLKNDLVEQCHIGFVDSRYIASIVFKKPIFKNVYILKLMQRRPNSTDPVGLDHMDLPVNSLEEMEKELENHNVSDWEYESNESHKWISVKFGGTEAKFVDHIVLDVCVKELRDVSTKLGFKPKEVA
jgi:hypothetical protein